MERISRSMDASLTGMSVMTARNMPKQVYLEDVIERIITFSKFQLVNTIYPEFDAVYKLDPRAKGICFELRYFILKKRAPYFRSCIIQSAKITFREALKVRDFNKE